MELTGNNGEIADFILHEIKDKGGYIRKDDLATMLADKYGWNTDAPDIVLDALENDYSFITRDGEVLRLTREGDDAANEGVKKHEQKRKFMERTVSMKTLIEIVVALITAFTAIIGLIIAN